MVRGRLKLNYDLGEEAWKLIDAIFLRHQDDCETFTISITLTILKYQTLIFNDLKFFKKNIILKNLIFQKKSYLKRFDTSKYLTNQN